MYCTTEATDSSSSGISTGHSSCNSNTDSLDTSSNAIYDAISKLIQTTSNVALRKKIIKVDSYDANLLNDNRILNNLLCMEDSYCIQSNYFAYVQNEIKPWMRTVLANWMLEVCENQKCEEDVFVLAMNILDRFLCVHQTSKRYLQLLGCACMFIASKLRCAQPLRAEKLVTFTDQSIFIEELIEWEKLVMQKLHWDVCSITANDFLPYLLKQLPIINETNELVFKQYLSTFIALCSTVLTPSMIASGCILNTINLLIDNSTQVTEKIMQELSDITYIEIDCLKECKEQIEELIESNYQLYPEIADKLISRTANLKMNSNSTCEITACN